MNIHGYVLKQLRLNVFIPTIKCRTKSINDSRNYRPISIMPVIGKVFEKCIANNIELYFAFHENQLGFVKNGGCGRALFALRNVVGYFRERRSKVLCCSLDISKVFDRINHIAILQAMSMKGVPAYVVRVLLMVG